MIAPSVGDILTHHVKLSVEGINRMYLNVYVPRLQAHAEQGIVHFFREHRQAAPAVRGLDEADEPKLRGGAGRLRDAA